jgi:hypothetical protein
MRVLIYKRTHTGDPDEDGLFGCNLCMGQVRAREFEAVIGVGGMGKEPVDAEIAGKVTWIGIGPHQLGIAGDGYPIWAFEKFYLKDRDGKQFRDKAPRLAQRMFKKYGARSVMADDDPEVAEVLKLARTAQPSPALVGKLRKPMSCKPPRAKKGGC